MYVQYVSKFSSNAKSTTTKSLDLKQKSRTMIDEPKTPRQLVAEARTNLAEKVSVAGLKEALQEHVPWIRYCFRLAMFAFACCIIYKTNRLILEFLHSGYVNEATEVAELETLPVSNVTICAQAYLNKTFVKANVVIPEAVVRSYIEETGRDIDELYNQLISYLALTTRTRKFSLRLVAHITKILRHNPQLNDFSSFVAAAFPKCENLLKNCRFNGKPFDCCQKAVQSIDDEALCYMLTLNYDSDNAFPNSQTWQQTRPGPNGGLSLEATVDLNDLPWLEDDIDNGFKIVVSPISVTAVQSPVTAPHAAETFVKVGVTKRLLAKDCVQRGQLSINTLMYYDPEGWTCMHDKLVSTYHKYISCHSPMYMYRPNSSITCSPKAVVMAFSALSGNFQKDLSGMINDRDDVTFKRVKATIMELENDYKFVFSNKAKCPNHCQYWAYSSTASFVDLIKAPGATENENVMFSRIHVYYGDLAYRQYREARKTTLYVAFCNFSNVVMLYLGMSVVSFFDVSFYLVRYLHALRRLHFGDDEKAKKVKCMKIGKSKVYPEKL